MSTQDRVQGYVVGKDSAGAEEIWKVRVTDKASEQYDHKLVVASIHEYVALAQGLEVTFIVGSFRGKSEQYYKAIDVRPVTAEPTCDYCKTNAEIGIEVSGSESGSADYIRTCIPCIMRAVSIAKSIPVQGIRSVLCINFNAGDKQWRRMIV